MSQPAKIRILDAAERLFARHGFEATSLRAIIVEAQVNLASVHYYYRSKEGLIRAVIERRFAPINQERLRLLEECQTAPGDRPPSVETDPGSFSPTDGLGRSEEIETQLSPDAARWENSARVGISIERIVEEQFKEVAHRFSRRRFNRHFPS